MKILKFYADWCSPCQTLDTILKDEDIIYESINVESDSDLIYKHKIKSLPTIVIVDSNGDEIDKIVGLIDRKELVSRLLNIV